MDGYFPLPGTASFINGTVTNYADLPSPASSYTGEVWWVNEGSQGLLSWVPGTEIYKYPKGLYSPNSSNVWELIPVNVRLSEDAITFLNITNWSEYIAFAFDISIGDKVIYNDIEYKNLTGTQTATTPVTDTTNWGLLTPYVDYIDFNLLATPAHGEGRMHWSADDGTLEVGMPGGNVVGQLLQEMFLPQRPKNTEGVQVNNGEVTYLSGATGAVPEIKLASAFDLTGLKTIALATENIANNSRGFYTSAGVVRDFDTTFGGDGDAGYLDTTKGQIVGTKPIFPEYCIKLGEIFRSHATEGVFNVNIRADRGNDLANFWNGTFRETFDARVTSNGTVITMSLEQSGGGNLTMQLSDGLSKLDCTPIQTIELTPGTDNIPQDNWIYVLESTKALTKSLTGWPSTEHIKVGYFFCSSALKVQSDAGPLINQNHNDHLAGTDLTGHLTHLTETVRLGKGYRSGIDGTGGDVYTTSIAGSVTLQWSSGIIRQMHNHTVPLLDTSVTGDMHIINAHATDGGAYFDTANLYDITVDSNGNTLTNKYFNIYLFATANKTGEYSPALVNIPTGSYNTLAGAESDTSGYDVPDLPAEFVINSATAFPIARLTMRSTGGTWVYQSFIDLRGKEPSIAVGGSIAPISDFSDASFSIFNNADNTKVQTYDLSAIATATTRIAHALDSDMTYLGYNAGQAYSNDLVIGASVLTVGYVLEVDGKSKLNGILNITDTTDSTTTTTGAEIIAGGLGVAKSLSIGQNVNLVQTTSSSTGIINKGGIRFLHDYHDDAILSGTLVGRNVFIGELAGNTTMGSTAIAVTEASYNVGIGYKAGVKLTTGYYNLFFGSESGSNTTTGNGNSFFGRSAGRDNSTGKDNCYFGTETALLAETGSTNFYAGKRSGFNNTSGSNGVYLGAQSGYYSTEHNRLYISSISSASQATEAGGKTKSLVYGEFNTTTADQLFRINGSLELTIIKSGATQAGAGASVDEVWKTASHATLPDNVLMMGV